MDYFLKKIQNEMDRREIQQKWLAKKIGVSPQSLNHYLQGKNKIKFFPFYILLRNVFEDPADIQEGIVAFINDTKKPENIKSCLEWSIQNGEHEIFEIALKKADTETASVYNLLLLRGKNEIKAKELFEQAETLKLDQFKQKENEVLTYIISLYALNDMKKYDGITLYKDFILKRVLTLKNGYLKDAYKMRVQELSAIAYLKENSVEKAINIAREIIEEGHEELFPLPVNSMFSLLGEAHVFTDGKKSIEYSKKAIKMFYDLKFGNYIYRELGLKATHDFIKIVNNDFDGLYLTDKSEEAHFLAKSNDKACKRQALKILEEIKSLSPHQLYYKALATGKREDFEAARKEFYKNGDFYYCKLVENSQI